jgi:hypothetical protein
MDDAKKTRVRQQRRAREELMLRYVAALGCLVSLGLSASPALSDDACKQAVFDTFTKQRTSQAFSMDAALHGESGPVRITVEYLPPDRMHQTIIAKDQAPLETTLVGSRAWSRQGGAWEELMPAIAQTIIAQVRAAVVDPPKDVGDFKCLGKVTVDGKEYLAYRSVEKPGAIAMGAGGTPVHRTVYVDPQTGLPALNIVVEEKEGAEPIFKGVYAYPADLEIEGHPDAPLVKMR